MHDRVVALGERSGKGAGLTSNDGMQGRICDVGE